jgi:hypothetical protein
MKSPLWNRRQILRGAGVALTLPWLETFAPRTARAQAAAASAAPRRYIALYFPNGTAEFWHPTGAGVGDAWKLSPILEPLAAVKSYVTVLQNVANYSPFGGHVEPSHSNCGASTWTCVRPNGPGSANSAISVDQVIADLVGGATSLPSMQIGLSTLDSYTDGLPGQHSRSISWRSATEPLYKIVNPQAVFDRLVADDAGAIGGDAGAPADAAALRRRALKKSALDYVLDNTASLQGRLGAGDRMKLDQYLTSVRSLEKRVAAADMPTGASGTAVACHPVALPRPGFSAAVGNVPPGYSREAHAGAMIDLIALAFQCDRTRVVSFMLDDARSDFVYDFLSERQFTDAGSTPGTAPVAGYHGLQHAGDRNNGFATIGWWNAQKAAALAQKLAAIPDGPDANVLENTVITFASGMHGGNHDAGDIPLALIGGGGKVAASGGAPAKTVLKMNSYVPFATQQRLADVHLTLIQKVFQGTDQSFGASAGIIPELLS